MRRRTDSASSAELTAQEDQIAQLTRERRINPQIGAALFLAPAQWNGRFDEFDNLDHRHWLTSPRPSGDQPKARVFDGRDGGRRSARLAA
jgi:hypothetical protein